MPDDEKKDDDAAPESDVATALATAEEDDDPKAVSDERFGKIEQQLAQDRSAMNRQLRELKDLLSARTDTAADDDDEDGEAVGDVLEGIDDADYLTAAQVKSALNKMRKRGKGSPDSPAITAVMERIDQIDQRLAQTQRTNQTDDLERTVLEIYPAASDHKVMDKLIKVAADRVNELRPDLTADQKQAAVEIMLVQVTKEAAKLRPRTSSSEDSEKSNGRFKSSSGGKTLTDGSKAANRTAEDDKARNSGEISPRALKLARQIREGING